MNLQNCLLEAKHTNEVDRTGVSVVRDDEQHGRDDDNHHLRDLLHLILLDEHRFLLCLLHRL